MDDGLRGIIVLAGLVTFVCGWIVQLWALARHRAPDSPGAWLGFVPRTWIEKREWFASEYGFRLYRSAGWQTVIGGLIMLAGWLL